MWHRCVSMNVVCSISFRTVMFKYTDDMLHGCYDTLDAFCYVCHPEVSVCFHASVAVMVHYCVTLSCRQCVWKQLLPAAMFLRGVTAVQFSWCGHWESFNTCCEMCAMRCIVAVRCAWHCHHCCIAGHHHVNGECYWPRTWLSNVSTNYNKVSSCVQLFLSFTICSCIRLCAKIKASCNNRNLSALVGEVKLTPYSIIVNFNIHVLASAFWHNQYKHKFTVMHWPAGQLDQMTARWNLPVGASWLHLLMLTYPYIRIYIYNQICIYCCLGMFMHMIM